MEENVIGHIELQGIKDMLRWHYERSGYVVIYSKEFGSIFRFKALDLKDMYAYRPVKERYAAKKVIKIKNNINWNLIDYIKWIIEGAGGKVKKFDCITFKELQDKVLVRII